MVFRLPPREEGRQLRRRFSGSGLRHPEVSELERRVLLSATPVVMDSATTADSHGVTIDYDVVTPPSASDPLTFGIYRAASSSFDSSAISVGSETIQTGTSPTLDDNGQPASAVGNHQLTIPLPSGLTINPQHPYVLAVANPTAALGANNPQMSASFHIDTIAVVSHGGLQLHAYNKSGPPWEQLMAYSLRQQGFTTVIPFNWVIESNTPGEAALQAPRLLRQVLSAAAQFPANDVVDIKFIGHSEGTVVNAQAIQQLEAQITPQIKAGWIDETMLDPHAANPDVPGQQYSVAPNPIGWLAKGEIDKYQAEAKDPPPTVPAGVASAEVFYQHTPAIDSQGSNDDIYNLWGQVPVKGNAVYFNLTGDRVTHSGSTGIYVWYERNVVPTLGDGAPQVAADTLTGTASTQPNSANPHQPVFSGTIAPGSFVKVMVAPASDPNDLRLDGNAIADSHGTWTIEGKPLRDGTYRVLAEALPPRGTTPRLPMVPTAPLGKLVIDAPRGTD